MDTAALTGPFGGIIAVAYAAGAASGYAFCLRTMYKILKSQAEKDEHNFSQRMSVLEQKLATAEGEIKMLTDRLLHGMERQAAQTRQSSVEVLGRDKLIRGDEE